MDLKDLVARWLKDEFPNWEVTEGNVNAADDLWCYISFKPLHRWQFRLFRDRVELDDDRRGKEVIIYAHDTRFFQLLWNRLHSMESGFQRAMASRDFHRPESK